MFANVHKSQRSDDLRPQRTRNCSQRIINSARTDKEENSQPGGFKNFHTSQFIHFDATRLCCLCTWRPGD